MEDQTDTVKDRVRRLIEATGLSQSQFARRIGVVDETVSSWVTGRNTPSTRTTEAISGEFGIETGRLMAYFSDGEPLPELEGLRSRPQQKARPRAVAEAGDAPGGTAGRTGDLIAAETLAQMVVHLQDENRQLKAQRDQLHRIIHALPVSMSSTDANLVFEWTSGGDAIQTASAWGRIVGQPLRYFLQGVHPESAAAEVESAYKNALNGRASFVSTSFDGKRYHVYLYPRMDAGHVSGVVNLSVDVTRLTSR